MKIVEGFALREVAGEAIVVPLAQSGFGRLRTYALTEEGAALWHALEQGADEAELVSLLAEMRRDDSEDAAEAAEDAALFLQMLQSIGALVEG